MGVKFGLLHIFFNLLFSLYLILEHPLLKDVFQSTITGYD